MSNFFNLETHSLVLRVCNADMTSYNGFVWPTSGYVGCPDWIQNNICGNGLHGWLYGIGSITSFPLFNFTDDTKWLVLSVLTESIIDLDSKVKFPSCEVLFCGNKKDATDFLVKHEPRTFNEPVIGRYFVDNSNVTRKKILTGDYGTSICGDNHRAESGIFGYAKSGDNGTSSTQFSGKSESGELGRSYSGYLGISISGVSGRSCSGTLGKSIAGDYGLAESGDLGTSIVGIGGYAVSKVGGKCKGGIGSTISIEYQTNDENIIPLKTMEVTDPDTFYKLDANNNFIKCD